MVSLFNRRRKFSFIYEEDMHSHVLPGLDDGPGTLDESLELIERMARFGLKRLTCTPHVNYPPMPDGPEKIRRTLDVVKTHLARKGVAITLDVAAEYKMGEYMLELIRENRVMASARGEVLLEHSLMAPSVYFREIVFTLQGSGLQPVLAHPERYLFCAEDVAGICREARWLGCKIQVNLLSFTGYYGKVALKGARKLYDLGYADYYAGDIHSPRQEMLLEKLIGGASF